MSSANQTILWNTVNRIPAFIQMSPPKRDLEFKRITDSFYRENANKPILSIDELRELNRKTVLAFLPSASSAIVSREKPPLHPSTPSPPVSESNMVETRQEKQERAFLERQNMYAQMTEKPNLPSPDMFKEKEPDEKITNMDELIENYQKQRNLEIPILPTVIPSIIPPTLVPSTIPSIMSSSVPLAPSAPLARKKNITFLEGNIELNSLEIQDLSEENAEKKNLASAVDSGERKNLAWNINLEETRVIEDSYLQELEKRIVSLEKQIQFLSERKFETQEKEIQTISISESEPNPEDEVERKEIEEIIESVILSIEQQNE
jgi:hypothetical protein